ncbi:amidohydrolase family protein [Mycobacterium hodleri]|uniref:Amidohydrolase family protein n=1 Tax=Mycolicibacterium hodleri TaxID=49897 RepID=A0A544W5M2_9MYCO|nr:amidohydrolase family protein [Mycolicibacterium hodleri]TQR87525.1 amidohydrolase family protein [Mycolicibacterium hodleri]
MSMHRTLIRNGRVLTMDPTLGDFDSADVLIEDGTIVAVGPHLDVTDAEVIDASHHIVLPGFIDTHRHTWQSLFRGVCSDWTLGDYYFGMRLGISPVYTADDVRLGNFYGAVDALNSGVTTLLDFSHCNNTPDHSDGAVQGLQQAGIRASFCYGFFESSPGETQFGAHSDRIADFHRIADTYFASDGLLTLGVSLSEIFGLPWQDTVSELAAARERQALLVNHAGCVFGSALCNGILEMDQLGLLGPDMVHVHCCSFGDAEWEALARSGGKVSISSQTEMNMGFGRPVFQQCKRHGIAPTLSADVISLNSGDLWHELRFGLSCARADAADPINAAGHMPDTVALSAREALDWTTVNAAAAMGLGDRVGSLIPGKRADLQIVGGPALEQHPVHDPYATLVFQTSAADVRTVLVDGRVVKRDGILTVADQPLLTAEVDAASERILGRLRDAGRVLPGTPPGAFTAIDPLTQSFHEQAVQATTLAARR